MKEKKFVVGKDVDGFIYYISTEFSGPFPLVLIDSELIDEPIAVGSLLSLVDDVNSGEETEIELVDELKGVKSWALHFKIPAEFFQEK